MPTSKNTTTATANPAGVTSKDESKLRTELSSLMKDLGMKVPTIPTPTSTNANNTTKLNQIKSIKHTPKSSSNTTAITTASTTPTTTSHKQKSKGRKNSSKSTPTPATSIPLPTPTPAIPEKSTNKNTLKNQQKRRSKKEALSVTHSETQIVAAENAAKLEAQKYAEENAKKLKSIAEQHKTLTENHLKWYQSVWSRSNIPESLQPVVNNLPPLVLTSDMEAKIRLYYTKAETLTQELIQRTEQAEQAKANRSKNSDEKWVQNILSSGTLTDKIAAITILIQNNTITKLHYIEQLLNISSKKNKRESQLATNSLKELFLVDLLPKERVLVNFASQPYWKYYQHKISYKKNKSIQISEIGEIIRPAETSSDSSSSNIGSSSDELKWESEPSNELLIYWYFEDRIKTLYLNYLTSLEIQSHDTMSYVKKTSIQILYDLVCNVPEREKQVLALLCNKLGDLDRKISSRVVYLLTQILTQHPAMKLPVLHEISSLLFRTNISARTQYYSIIFINQFRFNKGQDQQLAVQIIQMYFNLFAVLVKKSQHEYQKKIEHSQTSSSTITSSSSNTNKSYGGSNSVKNPNKKSNQANGTSNAGTSTAAKAKSAADIAINSKILGALLVGVNRALPYTEGSISFSLEQVNLLFQLIHSENWMTSLQTLMLLFHTLNHKLTVASITTDPNNTTTTTTTDPTSNSANTDSRVSGSALTDRFYRSFYEKLFSPNVITSSTKSSALLLNLLYKSMKYDDNLVRNCAFLQRLFSLAIVHQQVSFVCGILLLSSELVKIKPRLVGLLKQSQAFNVEKASGQSGGSGMMDDEEENFKDVVEDEEEEKKQKKKEEEKSKSDSTSKSTTPASTSIGYDPSKRYPESSGADCSSLYQLNLLLTHTHPSVQSFTVQFLTNLSIHYEGDPLQDFTPMNFYNRFVFKNPKQANKSSAADSDRNRVNVFSRTPSSSASSNVELMSSEKFNKVQDLAEVSEEQLFYYLYYNQKQRRQEQAEQQQKTLLNIKEKQKGKKQGKEDAEEEDIEEFADRIMEEEMLKIAGRADFEESDEEDELEAALNEMYKTEKTERKKKKKDGHADDSSSESENYELDSDVDVEAEFEKMDGENVEGGAFDEDAEVEERGEDEEDDEDEEGEGDEVDAWGEQFDLTDDEEEEVKAKKDKKTSAKSAPVNEDSDDEDEDIELPDFSEESDLTSEESDSSDSESENAAEEDPEVTGKKQKNKNKKSAGSGASSRRGRSEGDSVFASAEEFADILAESGETKENAKFAAWKDDKMNVGGGSYKRRQNHSGGNKKSIASQKNKKQRR